MTTTHQIRGSTYYVTRSSSAVSKKLPIIAKVYLKGNPIPVLYALIGCEKDVDNLLLKIV